MSVHSGGEVMTKHIISSGSDDDEEVIVRVILDNSEKGTSGFTNILLVLILVIFSICLAIQIILLFNIM